VGTPPADLILDPQRLDAVPVSTLLEAAGRAYVGVDHRFLHAIVDRPEQAIPELVRFAAEDHPEHTIDLDEVLLDIFRHLKTPEAVPFFIGLLGANLCANDELIEAFEQVAAAAIDPLLNLAGKAEQAHTDLGDIPFLLAISNVRDPRILPILIRHFEKSGPADAFYFEAYGDPAAIPLLQAALESLPLDHIDRRRIQMSIDSLENSPGPDPVKDAPFDIFDEYPKEDSAPLDALTEDDHLAMLATESAELKTDVASFYGNGEIPKKIEARLLQLAKSDPDVRIRGECWETLADIADEPEARKAMLAVLADPNAQVEEKAGVAVALAQQCDNETVAKAIEDLYTNPRSRAKALKAMARSFDRRFANYPAQHLDDPDAEIKRQAIWGVGYLNLSSEAPRLVALFDDDEFRSDALFAYAISIPGETTRGRIRALLSKVEKAAGGLKQDEKELVEIALDQRLMLHGLEPVFSTDDDHDREEVDEPAVEATSKPGRNDPCPCGSGKKYKKCCGA
jgi:hypothetical protein